MRTVKPMKQVGGWCPVRETRIEIDLRTCRYTYELHEKLKDAFGFPDDYGANWNAFWDYLNDFCGDLESERSIVIHGLSSLSSQLLEYSQGMLEVIRDAEEKYPFVHFSFE